MTTSSSDPFAPLPPGGPPPPGYSPLPGLVTGDTWTDGPPKQLGSYALEGRLGEGAQAVVYQAVHAGLERRVALKVLSPKLAADREFTERFHREARLVARLDHPNVVPVYDTGEQNGWNWLAMQIVDGGSLADLIARKGRLDERAALEITRGIALALDAASGVGILHRDVKPQNVLMTPDGIPKLSDLGLAKDHEQAAKSLTATGIAIGTPKYMSPEQAMAIEDVDVRSDIYSLGIMLHELVTGIVPLEEQGAVPTMMRHTEEDVPAPSRLNPDVSARTDGLVALMTARRRDERYEDARAVADDITDVLDGRTPARVAEAIRRSVARSADEVSSTDHEGRPGIATDDELDMLETDVTGASAAKSAPRPASPRARSGSGSGSGRSRAIGAGRPSSSGRMRKPSDRSRRPSDRQGRGDLDSRRGRVPSSRRVRGSARMRGTTARLRGQTVTVLPGGAPSAPRGGGGSGSPVAAIAAIVAVIAIVALIVVVASSGGPPPETGGDVATSGGDTSGSDGARAPGDTGSVVVDPPSERWDPKAEAARLLRENGLTSALSHLARRAAEDPSLRTSIFTAAQGLVDEALGDLATELAREVRPHVVAGAFADARDARARVVASLDAVAATGDGELADARLTQRTSYFAADGTSRFWRELLEVTERRANAIVSRATVEDGIVVEGASWGTATIARTDGALTVVDEVPFAAEACGPALLAILFDLRRGDQDADCDLALIYAAFARTDRAQALFVNSPDATMRRKLAWRASLAAIEAPSTWPELREIETRGGAGEPGVEDGGADGGDPTPPTPAADVVEGELAPAIEPPAGRRVAGAKVKRRQKARARRKIKPARDDAPPSFADASRQIRTWRDRGQPRGCLEVVRALRFGRDLDGLLRKLSGESDLNRRTILAWFAMDRACVGDRDICERAWREMARAHDATLAGVIGPGGMVLVTPETMGDLVHIVRAMPPAEGMLDLVEGLLHADDPRFAVERLGRRLPLEEPSADPNSIATREALRFQAGIQEKPTMEEAEAYLGKDTVKALRALARARAVLPAIARGERDAVSWAAPGADADAVLRSPDDARAALADAIVAVDESFPDDDEPELWSRIVDVLARLDEDEILLGDSGVLRVRLDDAAGRAAFPRGGGDVDWPIDADGLRCVPEGGFGGSPVDRFRRRAIYLGIDDADRFFDVELATLMTPTAKLAVELRGPAEAFGVFEGSGRVVPPAAGPVPPFSREVLDDIGRGLRGRSKRAARIRLGWTEVATDFRLALSTDRGEPAELPLRRAEGFAGSSLRFFVGPGVTITEVRLRLRAR